MHEDERNPYVILGIPYGANAETANRAFATKIRQARRGFGPWQAKDLTWALHEIEKPEVDPWERYDFFRIPADPQTYDPLPIRCAVPPSQPLERTTPPGAGVAELRNQVAQEIARHVARGIRPQLDTLYGYPLAMPDQDESSAPCD